MPENETEFYPETKKPEVLYHASARTDLDEIHALDRSYRDKHEGPQVFATPDLRVASMFMNRAIGESGLFNDVAYVTIVQNRDEFIAADKGGSIYEFNSEGFKNDPDKGLGKYEWTNAANVKPDSKKDYPSALQFMMDQGVQVYFVTPDQDREMKSSQDHGRRLLQSLKSENELTGKNFIPIPDYTENDAE